MIFWLIIRYIIYGPFLSSMLWLILLEVYTHTHIHTHTHTNTYTHIRQGRIGLTITMKPYKPYLENLGPEVMFNKVLLY